MPLRLHMRQMVWAMSILRARPCPRMTPKALFHKVYTATALYSTLSDVGLNQALQISRRMPPLCIQFPSFTSTKLHGLCFAAGS